MRRIHLGLVLLLLVGCSDDESATGWRIEDGAADQVAYGEAADVVVQADGETYVVSGTDDGCADLDGTCVDIVDAEGRYCDGEDAQADIIVDENGDVIEVICYPSADGGTPVQEIQEDGDGNISLDSNESGTVLTFPTSTDGQALDGNHKIDGERTTVYGNGVDKTILNGNVDLASNNARLRGLTITGNVQAADNSNNSKLVLCKVHGNVQVSSNGFSIVACQVFGNVQVDGNDATLINVGVHGEWQVTDSATCDGCYSFDDANDDFMVEETERGDALLCGDDK